MPAHRSLCYGKLCITQMKDGPFLSIFETSSQFSYTTYILETRNWLFLLQILVLA